MLASFARWWMARISELFPNTWVWPSVRGRDAIVIDDASDPTVFLRRHGKTRRITLADAGRMAARMPVILRPPSTALLVKKHAIPTVPRRDIELLLSHELSRITPFTADTLFWKWEGRTSPRDRTRMEITVMMVPKVAVASAMASLGRIGIRPDYLEIQAAERPVMLGVSTGGERNVTLSRVMAFACAGLAMAVVVLPMLLQAIALYQIDSRLDGLQPAIKEATSLRQALTAGGAAQAFIHQEAARNGDVLQVLARVTQVLPDDTFLTDLALRDHQLAISGRTASAPRLITGLAASAAIREPAFAAPITRIEGATMDAFQIKARLVP